MIQDFGVPIRHLKKSLEFFHEEVEIYPIWLCPAKAMDTGPVKALKDESNDPIHIDVGIYGFCEKPNYDAKESLIRMEKFARDHAGYQVIDNLTFSSVNGRWMAKAHTNTGKQGVMFCLSVFVPPGGKIYRSCGG